MRTWSRRLACSATLFAAALAAAGLFFPSPAAAAGCPTTPVTQEGGSHWCYKHDPTKGNVHLWKSPGYDASTAIMVVYIHGLDHPDYNNGADKCRLQRPYVDCIWDASDTNLVKQFADSGVNGLFVAVEGGPVKYPLWGSLSSLKSSIQSKGGIAPPDAVTLVGHSAGMYTVRELMGDASVKHVVDLDWVSDKSGPALGQKFATWYKQGGGRKLTLVGGSAPQQKVMDEMSAALPCTKAAAPASLTEAEIAAACLYMRTSTNHMRVVFDKKFISQAIKRSTSAAAGTGVPSPSGTSGSSGSTGQPLSDGPIAAPLLEIPIPNVNLTDAIRTDGDITFPWLAQYVQGVYTFLIGVAGLLAAVMMVVGGFQYLTSAGDKGKLSAGKEKIQNALTGLVLALGSYTILYVINPNLVAFDGIKVVGVQTVLSDDIERSHDEGDVYELPPETPSGPTTPAPGGLPNALCRTVDTCRPYCKAAGCVATPKCAPNPQTGVEECKAYVTCDLSRFPQSAPGIIPASQAVNAKQAFAGKTGIKAAQAGDLVSTIVRDGLIRAGQIADREGYEIVMTDGFRTLPQQFDLVCTRIVKADYWRPTKPEVAATLVDGIGSAVAWPGGSLHGAGFAADIQLNKKGGNQVVCSGCCGTQGNANYKDPSTLFDKIMTEAGARRYSNEIWHYEFGAPASVQPRCTYPNCPWPPSCKKKQASG